MTLEWPSLLNQQLWTIFLVFCRLGSALMLYPGMGESYIPPRLRLGFALVCTYCIGAALPPMLHATPDLSVHDIPLIVREILIGISSGLLMRVFFLTLESVGTVWSMQTGLSHVMLLNPLMNQPASVWGHALSLFGLALLFATDTHHFFLKGLNQSFQTCPLGQGFLHEAWVETAQQVGRASAELALTLSAPFLGAGLIFYTALGLMNRMIPQIQIFFVTQPLQILLGLLLISLVFAESLKLFLHQLTLLHQGIWPHG